MEKKSKKVVQSNVRKNSFYFFLFAYIIALITLFILFKSFLYSLVLGVVIGVFFFPINKYLRKIGLSKGKASLILVVFIFVLIIFASYLFVNSMVKEVTNTYRTVVQYDFNEVDEYFASTFGVDVSTEVLAVNFVGNVNNIVSISPANIIGSFAEIFIGLFLMLFLLFYIFKDGENILKSVMNILPVSDDHKSQMQEESRKVLYSVMYGQVLMAIFQGFLGGLAFFIFGLNNPLFWGLIITVLAFIPMLGTTLVWLPAGIIQLYSGNLFAGIGMLLYGFLILFMVENVVKPRVIGKRSGMHPLLVLLSIFGGLKVFGIIGIFMGPILVALCVLVISFFNQEMFLEKKVD